MAGKGGRKIVVRITSDTKGLKRGLMQADLTLKNVAKTGRAAGNVMGRQVARGATVAAGALALLYAKSAPAIDASAKMADMFGMTTAELYGMKQAGELAGVSNDKLTAGLERMQRRVGLAAKGTGAAVRAIDELGLSASEISKMGADEQYRVIAERISQVEGAANQAALAYEIFGRSGQQMLKLMNGGNEVMDEAAKRADRIGLALNRIDSAKVEASQDALTKASDAAQGLMNRITAKMAPAIELVANMFTDAAEESGGFSEQVDGAFDMVVNGAAFAADAIHGIKVVLKGVEVIATAVSSAVTTVFELVGKGVLNVAQGSLNLINGLIEKANAVPGINIAPIGTEGLQQARQLLTDIGESGRQNVGKVREELHNLMMEPLPGDELKQRIAEAYAKADEAAKAAAAKATGSAAVGGGEESVMTDAEKNKVEQLRQSLLTEEQLEKESHERRLEELNQYSEQLFETEAQKQAALQQLNAEHQAKLVEIRKKGMTELEKFNAMSWDSQAEQVAGSLADMTAGVAQSSRKMFEVNKAAAIAEATIEGIKGAEKTWNAYPYPWNIPMTVAHIATSMARIQKIKSTAFSGGGGGIAPSQAAQPATPVAHVGGGTRSGGAGGQSGGGQDIAINLQGEVFGRETVLSLIDGINSAVADGAQIKGVRAT
ncbi:MAG: hypothetical protein R3268_00200 [Acidiferrobacterales bacterium]|nr:hypothetical protein [Acidiferrobacterales bacterium]